MNGQYVTQSRGPGTGPDVEEDLNQWLSIVTGRRVGVSGSEVKGKSE
jgi:hypothetical protein